MSEKSEQLKGGEFVIKDAQQTFIPEEITEDQQMMVDMSKDFINKYIFPNIQRIEKQEDGIAVELMEKVGELGLLATHLPEQYGGLELDQNTNSLISDAMGRMGSFNTTMAAHTGIGTLPILFYGSEETKNKYLPKLASGEYKAAYCLTEPTSGSDALAAKTQAVLSEDGKHYEITGQKMWITNAGFANIFTVFAQVDGNKFTGFVLEGPAEGLTLGAEEDKLGIKGSSTRQVYFDKVKVPVENVLGEVGRGHLIAFNTLNFGRFKLGMLAAGGGKYVISQAVKYANEREQFNTPIANFGAIQYKLAEMAVRVVASESASYRTSDLMSNYAKELKENGTSYAEAKRAAAEEYAIESSIIKVTGSEAADYVTDENVQIHGGIGYSEEYSAARAYRDNRITRIFEGTNEINRLLIVDMLLKRAMKGKLDIVGPAWEVQKELKQMPSFEAMSGEYDYEERAVKNFKKLILMVAGAAAKEQMEGNLDLQKEQMLIMNVSDMMIDAYQAESLLLRVKKLDSMGNEHLDEFKAIQKVFLNDAQYRMKQNAVDAVSYFTSGDLHKIFTMGINRFCSYPSQNVIALRRQIAKLIISKGQYPFYM